MTTRARTVWLIVAIAFMLSVVGLAGTPTRAVAQAVTPTHPPPPPERTQPPGPRSTPSPIASVPTPGPTSEAPPATVAATPAQLPVAGAINSNGGPGLFIAFVGLGAVMILLSSIASRKRARYTK